jgi:dTDP-4-amino-4,6-dideoxygalactose transaminase
LAELRARIEKQNEKKRKDLEKKLMQFVDLAAQQNLIRDTIETNIQAVLSHGKYIMGPEIKELEKRLAEFVNVEHGIACSSGTDALLLALMAYDVGPGDAIFTSPFTFIATAEVISLLGATPSHCSPTKRFIRLSAAPH